MPSGQRISESPPSNNQPGAPAPGCFKFHLEDPSTQDYCLPTSVLARPRALSFFGSNFLSAVILAIRSARVSTLRLPARLWLMRREGSRLMVVLSSSAASVAREA